VLVVGTVTTWAYLMGAGFLHNVGSGVVIDRAHRQLGETSQK